MSQSVTRSPIELLWTAKNNVLSHLRIHWAGWDDFAISMQQSAVQPAPVGRRRALCSLLDLSGGKEESKVFQTNKRVVLELSNK